MPDRLFKRIPVNIEAEIISLSASCPAFIMNISEYGIYAKIANLEPVTSSKSDINVGFIFQIPSGETINLYCRKKWSYKNTVNSFIENIGVEIIEPPTEYKKFCQSMSLNP